MSVSRNSIELSCCSTGWSNCTPGTGLHLRVGPCFRSFLLQVLRTVWYSLGMTTNNLPIARTDANGVTWYPVADGQGWTSNIDFAAPHALAMDDRACIVLLPELPAAAPIKGSHAACSHASTKAARAACRKSRAAVA